MDKDNLLKILPIFLIILLISGCDTNVDPKEEAGKYTLLGSFVKNLDNDTCRATVAFLKDSVNYASATLRIAGDNFIYDGNENIYSLTYDLDCPDAGSLYVGAQDGQVFNDSAGFLTPFNFAITSISLPDNRINAGGSPVQFLWSTSLQTEGYIIAAVMKDSAYNSGGFSEFVEVGTPSGSLALDAFRLSGDLDTGWYYVYIYSFTGSPASDYNLPTAIPDGLTDNINHLDMDGSFGAIIVTRRDSVHVVAN